MADEDLSDWDPYNGHPPPSPWALMADVPYGGLGTQSAALKTRAVIGPEENRAGALQPAELGLSDPGISPGALGTNGNGKTNGNDKTMLYVAGGVAIAAVIGFGFAIKAARKPRRRRRRRRNPKTRRTRSR